MKYLFIVNNPANWNLDIPEIEVVSARMYLADEKYSSIRNAKVYNLCKSYRYQSAGYYVSLLASARGHKPVPNVLTIQDLKSQAIIKIVTDDLDRLIQSGLKSIQAESFTLSIYFGKNLAKKYDRLAAKLFTHFQAPLLRAEFIRSNSVWLLTSIKTIAVNEVPDTHRLFVIEAAREHFKKRPSVSARKETRYDLAILVNPDETYPPSDEKALQRFTKAAEELDFYVERITKQDQSRINEFDALFIRETTSVNHHTYRISRKAAAEGLVVIDDPESILRCTNKVFLAEILHKHKLPAPKTYIISPDNLKVVRQQLGFPCILKQPDSSFSIGVVKANDYSEFLSMSGQLFEKSDLLIVQEFLPTTFDWRVGILNRKPIYVCKYFMARKHWQIYERTQDGKTNSGRAETLLVEEAPAEVIQTALSATNLFGDGLYGVDLKEINGIPYVIEVNDNPSIDSGIEDEKLKENLYRIIMNDFLYRIEQKKRG
ncbi:MAG: RimK family protein [Balneolaceae bacterium]